MWKERHLIVTCSGFREVAGEAEMGFCLIPNDKQSGH